MGIARAQRSLMGAAFPAALTAWQAGSLLYQTYQNPLRVTEGSLGLSEFSRRSRLIWAAATGCI